MASQVRQDGRRLTTGSLEGMSFVWRHAFNSTRGLAIVSVDLFEAAKSAGRVDSGAPEPRASSPSDA
jgi:hypothetical protein